jgi:hypothetical protein
MQILLRPRRRTHCLELRYSIISTIFFPNPDPLQKRTCTKTYKVVAGDYCAEIEAMFGITDAQLHAWNPSINSGCTSTIPRPLPMSIALNVFGRSSNRPSPLRRHGEHVNMHNHPGSPQRTWFVSLITKLHGAIITTSVATYYDPNGGTGACPPYPVINNGDMAVAIGAGHWNGGAYCGKTMKVTCTHAPAPSGYD